MLGGEPKRVRSAAGICRVVGHWSGPGGWCRLARLAATYLLILAFVAPPAFAYGPGLTAHHIQKSGRSQRGKDRPQTEAKLLLTALRNPQNRTIVADRRNRSLLSPPNLSPALSRGSTARSGAFRPLRC